MTANGWLQILFLLLVVLLVTKPLGAFMARVFGRERTWLDPVLRPCERVIYKLTGVDDTHEMDWKEYALALLLFSGVLLFMANRRAREGYEKASAYLAGAIATGIAFVLLQGVEWAALLREGLTMQSSTHGAFFYLIVGAHALHAVAAICVLAAIYFPMRRGTLAPSTFAATQVFWYFVVLLWPVIYMRVYL